AATSTEKRRTPFLLWITSGNSAAEGAALAASLSTILPPAELPPADGGWLEQAASMARAIRAGKRVIASA
ncbi:MAG: hypothetical protein KKH54_07655, partial [Alphaproteobacteria bacterium]|nr:hypothetical protein [Alphaproteobacteria bacterium]